jgi:hypothetical protein
MNVTINSNCQALEENQMRRSSFYAYLLFLLIVTSHLAGGSYYVSTSGSNGNDGSLGKPWQTVNFGLGRIFPGDTLQIMTGTYYELLNNFTRSGLENQIITIKNHQNDKVIINSNGNWTAVEFKNMSYYHFQGLEITNAVWSGFNGTNYHHCVISDCVIHGIGPSSGTAVGIYVSPNTGIADSSTYNIIEHNVIYDCYGEGIYVGKDAHGLPPDGSRCNHNIIRFNEIYRCNEGIEVKSGSRFNQIFGNHLHDGNGGIYSAAVIVYQNTVVDSNLIHNNSNDGVYIQGNNNVFSRNIIFKNGGNGIVVTGNETDWNNYKDSGDDNSLFNNTICANASWGFYLWGDVNQDCRNTLLKNNISMNNVLGQLYAPVYASAGLVLDSNCWFSSTAAPFISYRGSSLTTVLELDQAYGSISNSFQVNPSFSSSETDDYSLQITSPMIDRGVPVGISFRGSSPDIGAIEYMPVYFPLHDNSDSSPLPVVFANVLIENTSSYRKPSYRIHLKTSSSLASIQSPLILQESDGTEISIPLQGHLPGTMFFGDLAVDDAVSEGPAVLSLQANSMLDVEGNQGSKLVGSVLFQVDKTPPQSPLKLMMK